MSVRETVSCLAFALVVCCMTLPYRAAVAEEVLRNQDVVKMAAAGLGDEIIVAKVQEASQVDFQLSVDDLVALRKAGLSERVVHAMLERSKPARPHWPGPSPGQQDSNVSLKTGEGTTPLHLAIGEVPDLDPLQIFS